MNASRWIAEPDSKRDCGHRRCRRLTWVCGGLLTAGGALIFGTAAYAITQPDDMPPVALIFAGLTFGAAAAAAACWPHPRRDDWMWLIDATREEHPRWPDWDTRELTQDRKTS